MRGFARAIKLTIGACNARFDFIGQWLSRGQQPKENFRVRNRPKIVKSEKKKEKQKCYSDTTTIELTTWTC